MRLLTGLVHLTFLWAVRDRVLHAVFAVGLFLLLLAPVFADFSMRQVQESAISLVLSASSLTLLIVAALLGSSAIFRDVDRRYALAILGLPITRAIYVVGRLIGLAIFLVLAGGLLFVCSSAVISFIVTISPKTLPIPWLTIAIAFMADVLKAILLSAFALLFSSVSTSFSLPFFTTIGIWFAGSASQEAYEYITGSLGSGLPAIVRHMAHLLYYLLPNFAGLNFHLQAIYGLPLAIGEVLASFSYSILYTSVIVWLSVLVFSRRELP